VVGKGVDVALKYVKEGGLILFSFGRRVWEGLWLGANVGRGEEVVVGKEGGVEEGVSGA